MGNVHRFQRGLLLYTDIEAVQKYIVQGQSYQIKALPFGLSTAPMEYIVIAKEVKLMALHKGMRIHQYLDDWLVRARSRQIWLQHTNSSNYLSGVWLVNLEKSEHDTNKYSISQVTTLT